MELINLNDLISLFESSRKIIWVMVPSGKATDDTIANLNSILNDGDIVIDGEIQIIKNL